MPERRIFVPEDFTGNLADLKAEAAHRKASVDICPYLRSNQAILVDAEALKVEKVKIRMSYDFDHVDGKLRWRFFW